MNAQQAAEAIRRDLPPLLEGRASVVVRAIPEANQVLVLATEPLVWPPPEPFPESSRCVDVPVDAAALRGGADDAMVLRALADQIAEALT